MTGSRRGAGEARIPVPGLELQHTAPDEAGECWDLQKLSVFPVSGNKWAVQDWRKRIEQFLMVLNE